MNRRSVCHLLMLQLCLALVLGTCTAATITYTGWGSASEIGSIEAEIAAFQTKYGSLNIDIRNQFVPWTGYHEKLIVQAAAGTLPDVMLISGSFFTNIEAYDVFLDLQPLFERDNLRYDHLPPGSKGFLTINGKLAGLPATGFRPGGAMAIVNTDLLDAAGLPQPSWDWTWDDVLRYAQQLAKDTNGDGENDQFGVDFANATWEAVWEYMLYAYGGSIWNDDYSACAINSPAGEHVFTFLRDLGARWQVSGGSFLDGNVGISICWAGEAARIRDAAPFGVALAPMPKGPAGRGIPPASGSVHVYAISGSTKYPEETWRFVRFLVTEPEAALARNLNSVAGPGYRPAMEAFARRFPKDQQDWLRIGLLQSDETPVARPLGSTVLISYDDRQNILATWLNRFYSGEIPITEALSGIEWDINVRLEEVRARAQAGR